MLAGAALLFLFFLLSGLVSLSAQKINSKTQLIVHQRSLLQQEIASLKEYAEMRERVESTDKLLEKCIGTEPDWHSLLSSLALAVSREAQLTSLALSYEGSAGELSLQGCAAGHDAVASLMERLEKFEELEDIRCLYTTETGSPERPEVQFELTASVLPGTAGGGRKEMS